MRLNWAQIICDIRSTRLTYGQIARITHIPKSTIASLVRRPIEPLYTNGEALVLYWCQRTGKPRNELPKAGDVSNGSKATGVHKNGSCIDSSVCESPSMMP